MLTLTHQIFSSHFEAHHVRDRFGAYKAEMTGSSRGAVASNGDITLQPRSGLPEPQNHILAQVPLILR